MLAAVDLGKLATLILDVSVTRLTIILIYFAYNWKCYRVAQVVADQQPGCLLQAAEIGADDAVHGYHHRFVRRGQKRTYISMSAYIFLLDSNYYPRVWQ